jgi:hypothetical protein
VGLQFFHNSEQTFDNILVKPRKPLKLLRVLGWGQSFIASIFLGSTWTPSLPTIWPRYSTSEAPKAHLDYLRKS